MIKNFEEHTEELNSYELTKLVPAMVNGLKTKIGKANAIKNADMVKAMKRSGYSITDVKVRKVINHIRNNALVPCLIATSKGYYVGDSLQELEDYVQSLAQREKAIKDVRVAIQIQIREKYETKNQTTLFT